MTATISLTEASERLGVHYMTAYRYVRTGRLPAEKVAGQWHVTVEDLETFTNEDPTPPAPRGELIPPMLVERLLAGDENGAFQLLESAMASGAGAEEVYLDFISPSMTDIGIRWHDGEISIADEHVASSTALRVVSRLGPRIATRGRNRGNVVLAVVSDDHHGLPTALLRDILRSRGFGVHDLGANTPPESILERAKATDDLIAIGLCSTKTGNDDIVRETLSVLNEGLDVPIIVGGASFKNEAHISSLGICLASTSSRQALALFDNVHAKRLAS